MTATATNNALLQRHRERARNGRAERSDATRMLEAAQAAGDGDAEETARRALDHARVEIETADTLEKMELSSMAGVDTSGYGGGIFDDPETVELLKRMGNGHFPIGTVPLGPVSTREELIRRLNAGSWGQPKMAAGGDVTVPDSARVGTYYGTVPQLRRPLSLLDLIPMSTMDGESFGYMQEGGSLDDAAETVEGAVKPAGDLTLAEAQVTAATIAVWIKMKRQQLADTPSLSQTVNNRLTYSCLRRLENQVLAGDGVDPNIRGILTTPGIGSVAFSASEALSDLTLDAIVATIQSDAVPDAAVFNPTDWAAMLKTKASGSGVRLDSEGMFSAPPNTAWGLPAVTSKAMPVGKALVGAFGTCCTIFIRQAVTLLTSDSDQDDFTRNRVTVLADLRAGSAVWQPAGFTEVHFA